MPGKTPQNSTSTARTTGGDVSASPSASEQIDARLHDLRQRGDWRGEALSHLRMLIRKALPDVLEEIKWRKPTNPAGVPAWSRPRPAGPGMICTGELHRDKVKLTFARGAALDDPAGLFNSGLTGRTRRAIDLHRDDPIDDRAFIALVQAAGAPDARSPSRSPRTKPASSTSTAPGRGRGRRGAR